MTKVKVLRMEFSIVENLSGLQESIFNLSRGPQLHFGEKLKHWSNFIKFIDFPLFPLFGVPLAAVILHFSPNGFQLSGFGRLVLGIDVVGPRFVPDSVLIQTCAQVR